MAHKRGGRKSSRHNPLAHVKSAFTFCTPTMSYSDKRMRKLRKRVEAARKRAIEATAARNAALSQGLTP